MIQRITPTDRSQTHQTDTPYVYSNIERVLGRYKLVETGIETYVNQPKVSKRLLHSTVTDLGVYGLADIDIVRSESERVQVDLVQFSVAP